MKRVSPREALRSLSKFFSLSLCGSLLLLTACGKGSVPASRTVSAPVAAAPHDAVDSEGMPVTETAETLGPDFDDAVTQPPHKDEVNSVSDVVGDSLVDVGAKVGYQLPDFQASWGMSRAAYDRAVTFMDLHAKSFSNQRYVIVVDMSKHSSNRRLFLFDLETGKLETHNVAHGSGSDPSATGYATRFSNRNSSQMTSLGAYRTAGTYQGKHGTHLRLEGLEDTNSAALSRGIVLHGASYVNDGGRAGRSWGCPAVDQRVVNSLISRVRGGAMLLIWK